MKADRGQRPRYQFTVEALPDPEGVPAARRIAQMLKTAWRRHRLKCVDCKELPAEGSSPTDDEGDRECSPETT